MKKLFYIAFLMLITGCVAKKTKIEYKERIVKDTISVFKDRIITKSVIDTLLVEKPCDSLGNLKDFEKMIKTDIAQVRLTNNKGNIEATINIDSIQQVWEKEVKSSIKKEKEIKQIEVVKFRYPLWLIVCLVVSVIANIALLKTINLPFISKIFGK